MADNPGRLFVCQLDLGFFFVFAGSLDRSSVIRCLVDWLVVYLVGSMIRSFVRSFVPWFVRSSVRSFARSFYISFGRCDFKLFVCSFVSLFIDILIISIHSIIRSFSDIIYYIGQIKMYADFCIQYNFVVYEL